MNQESSANNSRPTPAADHSNQWLCGTKSGYRRTGDMPRFLRTWTVRYMLSPVRLSSVCNARAPYSGGWNFRQYFYGVRYLGHRL